MKSLLSVILSVSLTLLAANNVLAEKPVQHLNLPDVTSFTEAKTVFSETTAQIEAKTKLDAEELHQIHIITYSLEKAVAYFAENTTGEQQQAAQKMAEVVEMIHLGSENNRKAETAAHLKEYSQLAQSFYKTL